MRCPMDHILLLRLAWFLEQLEEQPTVCGKEGREHKGLDSHELDEDVERGARGILQRVTNGVANHSSLVAVRSLGTQGPCVLTGTSLKQVGQS